MHEAHKRPYGHRALEQKNPAAKLLLETMERKKSNLAVSVDVTKAKDFLAIVDVVGPFVCLIKAISLSPERSASCSHRI
jgi:orotidine-5'-phosphate decarboxylase